MAKTPTGRTPFDVRLKDDDKRDLVRFLCDAVQGAVEARGDRLGDLDYAYTIYEQGRTRAQKSEPYVGGADLTSYLGTQYVDALTSRAVRTIFTEPIWIVEGLGTSSARAPIVEEFHQWKAEQERLQVRFARAVRTALIEGRSALELYEGSQLRRVRKEIRAAVAFDLDPMTGEPLVRTQPDGKPELQREPNGRLVEVDEDQPPIPTADVVVESWDRVRTGPQCRVLSNRDFVVLPEHATQREDVWGWAKRFTRRVPELRERVEQDVFDADAVEALGPVSDIDGSNVLGGRPQTIAPQDEPDSAEKELWDVTFLKDLDDDGFEEWYIATVSLRYRQLLRLKRDDLDQQRFVLIVPLTRAETELDGYSIILDKLGSIIEEHTIRRNVFSDRSEMAANAPVKRLEGSTWKPEEHPWGPRAVIPVGNMNEVEPVQVPDVPQSAYHLLGESIESAERVMGLNDASMGINPQQDRTLGEVRMVQSYSEIRVDEVMQNLREALEDIFQVRHAMYVRLLEEGEGEAAPQDVLVGLERRLQGSEVSFDGQFTAALLKGNFRGKPRGSVETADLNVMRADFNQFLQGLASISQVNPAIQAILATPQAAQALLEQALRVYRFPDRQAILGSAMQAMQAGPAGPMGMAGQPPQPALPPGMPAGMPAGPSPLAGNIVQSVLGSLGTTAT